MRKRLYDIIEPKTKMSKLSKAYDIAMIIIILLSFVPLVCKYDGLVLDAIDLFCVSIFIIDYLLRWATADYRFGKKGIVSFIRYPVSAMAVIDLLTILPSIIELNSAFRALRVARLIKALRVLRFLRLFRYSRNMEMLKNVFYTQRYSLILVLILTIGYVFISALVMYQVEPDTFGDFFDALYWATVTLTTVGYGDLVAATAVGRGITMLSSLMGIAVIALPAGIITAGYVEELKKGELEKKGLDLEEEIREHGLGAWDMGETEKTKAEEEKAE